MPRKTRSVAYGNNPLDILAMLIVKEAVGGYGEKDDGATSDSLSDNNVASSSTPGTRG